MFINIGFVNFDFFTTFIGASKLISSKIFSKIVCNLLAPIFSIVELMCVDISAIVSIASSVNSSVTFSVLRRAVYCLIKLLSGSFKIFIKSFLLKHLIQHELEVFPEFR